MLVPFRPLGLIKDVIEATGLTITHVFEDLVFIEHNAFFLQMGDRGEDVRLYFNTESQVDMREEIARQLAAEGRKRSLDIARMGTFRVAQDEGSEQFHLEFLDGIL
jgi:hypothetical protein